MKPCYGWWVSKDDVTKSQLSAGSRNVADQYSCLHEGGPVSLNKANSNENRGDADLWTLCTADLLCKLFLNKVSKHGLRRGLKSTKV